MNAIIAVAITIVFTATSQLLQKRVALLHRDKHDNTSTLAFYLREPSFWLALICLALGMLSWLFALSILEVGKAYALLSINYLLVPLAAIFLFNERLPMRGWFGALLLCIGVVLIGSS